MIERFRRLFIDGSNYPDAEILSALETLTATANIEQEFKFFLNRCCHILINRWHMQPQTHGAISELIALFESTPARSRNLHFRDGATRRLHELVKQFKTSEQYAVLCRLGQVVNARTGVNIQPQANQPLVTLISRYPYLYEHCLLSDDASSEHKLTVRNIQTEVQRQFELDLSRYVTDRVRINHIQRLQQITTPATQIINPTLLSDRSLNATLYQFLGKIEGNYSYQELAQSFLIYTHQTANFGQYKDNLYEYLISGIDRQYGNNNFHNKLYNHLHNTLPDANGQLVDEFLIIRTCSQILNFLVVESQNKPQHYVFIDLIANQGTLRTTGLLLKVVLICHKVKPILAKRLAILFNHYESASASCIRWLVESLETVNVGLSIHFGNVDLSHFKTGNNF